MEAHEHRVGALQRSSITKNEIRAREGTWRKFWFLMYSGEINNAVTVISVVYDWTTHELHPQINWVLCPENDSIAHQSRNGSLAHPSTSTWCLPAQSDSVCGFVTTHQL